MWQMVVQLQAELFKAAAVKAQFQYLGIGVVQENRFILFLRYKGSACFGAKHSFVRRQAGTAGNRGRHQHGASEPLRLDLDRAAKLKGGDRDMAAGRRPHVDRQFAPAAHCHRARHESALQFLDGRAGFGQVARGDPGVALSQS